jgi:cytolysin-activating lysine-acyltransferase
MTNFTHPHAVLGAMTWLMSQSPYHRHWTAHDIHTEIVPALILQQYRIYQDEAGNPVGFVTWAELTADAVEALTTRRRTLQFDDWRAGDTLLFNDFVAPFGHGTWMVNELRQHVFPDRSALSLRRNPDGSIRKINRWWGKRVTPSAPERPRDPIKGPLASSPDALATETRAHA